MKKKLLFSASALAFVVTCSHGQIFQDNFETDQLVTGSNTNINVDVPDRQTGDVTGSWTEDNSAKNGSGVANSYLNATDSAYGGSFLDGNALVTHAELSTTNTISAPIVRSTNLATQLAGTAYTFSGSVALLDTGANSMSTFENAGTAAPSNFQEANLHLGIQDSGGGVRGGLTFNIATNDLSSWEAWVYDGNSTQIDTISLPNFDFDTRLNFTLHFDETGANDQVSGTFNYGSESISFSNIAFDFDDEITRNLKFGSRIFAGASNTDIDSGTYSLTAHGDNFTVVPEPAAYALGLGLAALTLGLTRRVKYRKN